MSCLRDMKGVVAIPPGVDGVIDPIVPTHLGFRPHEHIPRLAVYNII